MRLRVYVAYLCVSLCTRVPGCFLSCLKIVGHLGAAAGTCVYPVTLAYWLQLAALKRK